MNDYQPQFFTIQNSEVRAKFTSGDAYLPASTSVLGIPMLTLWGLVLHVKVKKN